MKKQANFLRDTNILEYYPAPVLPPDVFKQLSLKAFRLYHYILSVMKARRSWIVELTPEKIQDGAGLYAQDLKRIREELKRQGLVDWKKKENRRYEFALLEPVTCKPVQYLEDYVYRSLNHEQLHHYFHLRFSELNLTEQVIETNNGLRLDRCKWCDKRK